MQTTLENGEASRYTIIGDAERAYPEECCGFLFGQWVGADASVTQARAVGNIRTENRRRRFEISPEDYRAAEAYADSNSLVLIGVYHSHPDHPAEPSQYDLEHAFPGLLYLIVSVCGGRAVNERWWELAPDRSIFHEVPATTLNRLRGETL